jgi:hypothetical protein
LLLLFGDLTALTADEQYLAQSSSSQNENNLTEYLNTLGLLDSALDLFQTLKQASDTMAEVRNYHTVTGTSPEGTQKRKKDDTPPMFAGFYSKLAKLIANLTYL